MLNRRAFIKRALSAGVGLGSAAMFNGCGGLTRKDFPDFHETTRSIANLDNRALAILYHASLAPSGHNSQPWRVRVERPDGWVIEADHQRRLPAVDPENRELLLSIGAFVENLSLAAGTLGLKADVQVIARTHQDRDILRVVFHKETPTPYPLHRLETRRTVKHGQTTRELAATDIKAFSEKVGNPLFYFPRGSRHADCMRQAAVESYRIQATRDDAQQELVRWLRLSDRDTRRYRDGLTTEGMEITGSKGWLVRHFIQPESFLKPSYRQQGIDLMAELADQGGGWMVITSPGETVPDVVETGRRFQRMALLARERGIGIHPMTQMLEEKSSISQIAGHHGSRFFPQFVLRVGYLERYPQPVSLRRPVEWFVTT